MAEATTVHGIDASYYMTKDLAAAVTFYNDFLGMEPSTHMPGMVAEYTFGGGETFGLYQGESPYAGGTILFRVDDVAAFVKAAMAKGVPFEGDGFIEDTPVCHMAFGADPDGNKFIIHKSK